MKTICVLMLIGAVAQLAGSSVEIERARGSMSWEEVVGKVRDQYLDRYRGAIAGYRERFSPGGPEVLLEVEGEGQEVFRLHRFDLASGAVKPPNLTEVNSETHLEFDILAVEYEGIAISLAPFVWNGVEFNVSPPIGDTSRLAAWALRWIDPSESNKPDADGLGGYLHSITRIESDAEMSSFSVDFGSAPLNSWRELFDVLASAGTKRVKIHSRSVLEDE